MKWYVGFLLLLLSSSSWSNPDGIEFFERKIRPVLAESCYLCHGAQLQQGELKLNSPAAILEGGMSGNLIVPGDPDASLLIEVVRYENNLMKMPPGGPLPEEQVNDLVTWVKMGAPMPDPTAPGNMQSEEGIDFAAGRKHWAFQPLDAVQPPSEPSDNPVDAFLDAAMDEHGLLPANPADKNTWLRRVTFGLTGLPPTPEELEAFLDDDSPDARADVIDRLLGSPHYGERWGRHWLDLMRFAETDGHEFDHDKPNIWRYRDYVIRAFNQDIPYNQFVMEHVAGDQLDNPRVNPDTGFVESPLGTGFFWLGDVVNSPVDSFQAHSDRLENQIDVFGKAFLGLTVACARCHDHKFDPVSDEDYYALAGIFESSRVWSTAIDSPYTQENHEKIINDIQSIDRAITDTVSRQTLADTKEWILALRDLKQSHVEDGNDTVIADFEKGSYEQWEVCGEAFHTSPPRAREIWRAAEVDNWRGRFIADSFHNSSDEYTGRLTSKEFDIDHNYIRFLLGGGTHPERTCANLLVDGTVVRTQTAHNSDHMKEYMWDVREFWGQTARIELVDEATESWGHIIADHFVLTNGDEIPFGNVEQIAEAKGLDPVQLKHWLDSLHHARNDVSSPLYPWAELLEPNDTPLQDRIHDLHQRLASIAPAIRDSGEVDVYEDFLGGTEQNWIWNGDAFTSAIQWNPLNAYQRISGSTLVSEGARGFIHTGLVSPRFQGVAVSPIFMSDKRYVHVRMAGNGWVNVVSDEFRARNHRASSHDEFRWYTHDILMYMHKRNYVEIVDQDPDGYVIVDQIVFSDDRTPPDASHLSVTPEPHPSIVEWLSETSATSIEELAISFAELLQTELATWTYAHHSGHSPETRSLVDWLHSEDGPMQDWEAIQQDMSFHDKNRLASLLDVRNRLEGRIHETAFALTMTDHEPGDTRLHIRGSHKELGDEVPRAFLTVLAGESQQPIASGSGRLELAQRMMHSAEPLLARVMVNRIWRHHFGVGLVKTTDNFGVNGARPSHPELLDYLADYFIDSGWSVKAMHRLILSSAAYQRSSMAHPESLEIDPINQYVHHMPVRRLEAESIRDALLAVSGELNPELFGPSVLPYLTEHMDGRGRPPETGPLDGDGRRSIYINVRRNFMTPMFVAFDYPPPISAIGNRGTSTVPAQALTMMNNEFVYQQANAWAERIVHAVPDDPEERIRQMYFEAFSRAPTQAEKNALLAFVSRQSNQEDDLDIWSDVSHILMNLTEFIFVN